MVIRIDINCYIFLELEIFNYSVDVSYLTLYFIGFTAAMSGLAMLGAYALTNYVFEYERSGILLTVVIGVIDVNLPFLFGYITSFEKHRNSDHEMDSLLVKLIVSRLIIPIVFRYFAQINWQKFLDENTIIGILSIQLATCFAVPLNDLLDIYNVSMRHIVAPCCARTQREYNGYWKGSWWNLAERYTNISKLLFVTFAFSLLTPLSLFIGAAALVLVFFVDR